MKKNKRDHLGDEIMFLSLMLLLIMFSVLYVFGRNSRPSVTTEIKASETSSKTIYRVYN